MSVRTHFREDGLADIQVDGQHISRLTGREIRELVFQLLIFGGKKLRDEVLSRLSQGKIELIAEVICGENSDQQLTETEGKTS